ncbi:MAG: hypothetical protein Q4B43_10540 [Bacteroidota bacterium]|nr:hypothetical protein [Bacteroidota bacterium]
MKNTARLLKKETNNFKWLFLIVFCSINLLNAQPCTFTDVINRTTENVPYKKYNISLDMQKVLNEEKSNFYGFIGLNYKRLRITFTSIVKNKNNENVYEVEGFSTVMNKNKRHFKGTFIVLSHYQFTKPTFDDEEPKEGEMEGFSTFSYILKEDEKLSATGIFEGKMLVLWYKEKNKQPIYSDLFFYSNGGRNYQFIGTWTSYRTKKSSVASWGQWRIPCSDDFDGGVGDFMPDPKYWQYGWEEFRYDE